MLEMYEQKMSETLNVYVIDEYRTYRDGAARRQFMYMLRLTMDEYKSFKNEVSVFYARNKRHKSFMVFATHSTYMQLAYDYIVKIKPILEFIVVRNLEPHICEKILEILSKLDTNTLEKYFYLLNSDNEYGKSLIHYKLSQYMLLHGLDIKRLVLLMFNLQPMKERPVSQSTVGFGSEEFSEMQGGE